MERRHFLGCAALAAPLYSGVAAAQEGGAAVTKPRPMGCKLTVVKRSIQQDLADRFRNGQVSQCDVFKDGQEFVLAEPWLPPQGFCQWAWADIRPYVMANLFGGQFPMVACCTDGFRPVHFRIERIELGA